MNYACFPSYTYLLLYLENLALNVILEYSTKYEVTFDRCIPIKNLLILSQTSPGFYVSAVEVF